MPTDKINVKQARNDVEVSDALLVCAYDNTDKFHAYHLEHAIPLADLRAREDDLAKERELIFYCA